MTIKPIQDPNVKSHLRQWQNPHLECSYLTSVMLSAWWTPLYLEVKNYRLFCFWFRSLECCIHMHLVNQLVSQILLLDLRVFHSNGFTGHNLKSSTPFYSKVILRRSELTTPTTQLLDNWISAMLVAFGVHFQYRCLGNKRSVVPLVCIFLNLPSIRDFASSATACFLVNNLQSCLLTVYGQEKHDLLV